MPRKRIGIWGKLEESTFRMHQWAKEVRHRALPKGMVRRFFSAALAAALAMLAFARSAAADTCLIQWHQCLVIAEQDFLACLNSVVVSCVDQCTIADDSFWDWLIPDPWEEWVENGCTASCILRDGLWCAWLRLAEEAICALELISCAAQGGN